MGGSEGEGAETMDAVNLRKLKRPQLIEIAEHFKLKKRHRLRKRDLVKALEKRLAEIPEKFSAAFQKPKRVETSSRFAPAAPPPQPAFVDRGAPLPLHYGQDEGAAALHDSVPYDVGRAVGLVGSDVYHSADG